MNIVLIFIRYSKGQRIGLLFSKVKVRVTDNKFRLILACLSKEEGSDPVDWREGTSTAGYVYNVNP